jgi:hypothetical protein
VVRVSRGLKLDDVVAVLEEGGALGEVSEGWRRRRDEGLALAVHYDRVGGELGRVKAPLLELTLTLVCAGTPGKDGPCRACG